MLALVSILYLILSHAKLKEIIEFSGCWIGILDVKLDIRHLPNNYIVTLLFIVNFIL